eukprot:6269717-Prymnesium_polylepis.1
MPGSLFSGVAEALLPAIRNEAAQARCLRARCMRNHWWAAVTSLVAVGPWWSRLWWRWRLQAVHGRRCSHCRPLGVEAALEKSVDLVEHPQVRRRRDLNTRRAVLVAYAPDLLEL